MSSSPELDQVTEARRRLAEHAGFPRTYWVLYAFVSVFFAGVPIWMSYLPADDWQYMSWAIAAIGLASTAYVVIRRRVSGVHLPKGVSAYPGAQRIWFGTLAVTIGGFFAIQALVTHDHRGLALALLLPVAAVLFFGQISIRRAMRADLEAGRVTP
jgi:hypothetical protein